ncbi:MAG: hypothetical protein A7316_04845 [Candidatus Altiarchaeales archaeon WOR_SM1_86-2]|nr:MAG: hypothetical protein A7315_04700 [Candidatus Altiarchaeales archaeon WOR_SM1_79]ODS39684.1 MAG: hypothetical protein A7316_04845 [Candidatus Altiarchaeales archaeon WOR_SM1_86-2]
MAKVYQFKAALKHRKGLWRRIEIGDDQTLGDLDDMMREAFKHDTFDHLSEFYRDHACRSGFGEIYPDGGGQGSDIKIGSIGTYIGAKMGYVYDFGDYIQHVLTLEEIKDSEKGVKYPPITDKSRIRKRYCDPCKDKGKKSVAAYVCIDCSDDEERTVNICEECAEGNMKTTGLMKYSINLINVYGYYENG